MKIYLAGPMRGIPDFNFPKFNQVADLLRTMGHEVFNPAEKGEEALIETDPELVDKLAFRRRVFAIDTEYICNHAEAIVLLPGWEKSTGAIAEEALAHTIGLVRYEWPECPPSIFQVIPTGPGNIHMCPPAPKPKRYIDPGYYERMDQALAMVREELIRARTKHGPMKSGHEGHSILQEEVDELWDDIKANKPDLLPEAMQVAAMGVAFMVDVCEMPDPYCTRDGACGIDHGVCDGLVRRDM